METSRPREQLTSSQKFGQGKSKSLDETSPLKTSYEGKSQEPSLGSTSYQTSQGQESLGSTSYQTYRGQESFGQRSYQTYQGKETNLEEFIAPKVRSFIGTHEKPLQGRIQETVRDPPMVERVQKPTVIKEVIRPRETIEINPVIEREREQLEVDRIVQPLHEKVILPTVYEDRQLPLGADKEFRESDEKFLQEYRKSASAYAPSSVTEEVVRETVHKEPIIREHVRRKIIQEIQPVLYKEVDVPKVIRTTVPVHERIAESPVSSERTLETKDLGVQQPQMQMQQQPVQQQPVQQQPVQQPVYYYPVEQVQQPQLYYQQPVPMQQMGPSGQSSQKPYQESLKLRQPTEFEKGKERQLYQSADLGREEARPQEGDSRLSSRFRESLNFSETSK